MSHYLLVSYESKDKGRIYGFGVTFPVSKRAQEFGGTFKTWNGGAKMELLTASGKRKMRLSLSVRSPFLAYYSLDINVH